MIFTETKLKGAYVVDLEPIEDERGWFSRTYCKREFASIGIHEPLVQINHSFNRQKGTIRGLHFQRPPFAEIKLVRCISGSVFDVIVDIRRASSTFLKFVALELSSANRKMILVPKGFAHGFQVLEENSELLYHHTEYYQPGIEAGIRFDETILSVNWPLPPAVISDRDAGFEKLNDFQGI